LLALLVSAHAAAAVQAISIAQARALPLGTVVTVDGSVTTPSGAFESSFFDKGFGLQDKSAGIYVSLQTDLHVAPRRQARVTGTLQDSFGLLILVPSDPSQVKLHGTGPKVGAQWVTTGAVGEATEGRIVRVVGTITQAPMSDGDFGSKFFVDDGSGELQIFVNVQTGIDLSGLSAGQTVSVTGFSSQFDTHYEIDPRFPSDIAVPAP
jgi:DNA/RNA endonuclease YhcR with UshA esterase domain